MGIQGLVKALTTDTKTLDDTSQVIPAGTTLLVDASGYIFHLLDMEISNSNTSIRRELLDSYTVMHRLLEKNIKELQAAGIIVVFVFDGSKTRMKSKFQ